MNDLIYAFRQLAKKPGFTAVALLTLALGIGATTGVYSVIHNAVIDPFPFPDAHHVFQVESSSKQEDMSKLGVNVPLLGLAPAWHASKVQAREAIKESGSAFSHRTCVQSQIANLKSQIHE